MSIQIYNAIGDFVSALSEIFTKNKPLALYNKLIEKTPIRDKERINKHINVFQKYLGNNKNFLIQGKLELLGRVEYSEQIFIDVPFFIKKDKEIAASIRQHLLNISMLISPDQSVGQLLTSQPVPQGPNPMDMLGNMMNMFGGGEGGDNPMAGMMGAMMGGEGGQNPFGMLAPMINDMREGMETGKFDMRKMFSGLHQMMDNLEKQLPDEEADTALPESKSSSKIEITKD